MSDTNSKEINNKNNTIPEATDEEIKAFEADLELAEYMARVKNGELTEDEKANRNTLLNFLGYPIK